MGDRVSTAGSPELAHIEPNVPAPAREVREFDQIQDSLAHNISRLQWAAWLTLVLTVVATGYVYYDIKTHIGEHIGYLNGAKQPNHVLAYLLYRSSGLGVIAGGLIYVSSRITLASFDQSMRFTKRRIGALFLEHLHNNYRDRRDLSLSEIMLSFEVWNKTVESAFSGVKPTKPDDATNSAVLQALLRALKLDAA